MLRAQGLPDLLYDIKGSPSEGVPAGCQYCAVEMGFIGAPVQTRWSANLLLTEFDSKQNYQEASWPKVRRAWLDRS